MYRALFILLPVMLVCGCNASRKAVKEEAVNKEILREDNSLTKTVIDTTITEAGVMEIVKLKFDLSPTPDKISPRSGIRPEKIKTAGGINLPGKITEAEIITIRQNREEKGLSTTKEQKGIRESSEEQIERRSDKKIETGFAWGGSIIAGAIVFFLVWILFKKNPP